MSGMPQQPPERSSAPARPRPDASMSLLTRLMDHSLDDGYAEAAARHGVRPRGERLPQRLRGRAWLAVGLVLTALVLTVGAAEARIEAPDLAREREELIERVEDRTAAADDLDRTIEKLHREVADRQREALEESGSDEAALLALLAGAAEAEGPGVRLVVDDAADAGTGATGGPRSSTSFADDGRVRDRDLQRIVNGLWLAGAEAVSVNGRRLTALSAIRAAGDAILVDNRPLAPPYTVLAIGDGERLLERFRDNADGRYLEVLQDNYGIRAGISTREDLRLPAATGLSLRHAEPKENNPS